MVELQYAVRDDAPRPPPGGKRRRRVDRPALARAGARSRGRWSFRTARPRPSGAGRRGPSDASGSRPRGRSSATSARRGTLRRGRPARRDLVSRARRPCPRRDLVSHTATVTSGWRARVAAVAGRSPGRNSPPRWGANRQASAAGRAVRLQAQGRLQRSARGAAAQRNVLWVYTTATPGATAMHSPCPSHTLPGRTPNRRTRPRGPRGSASARETRSRRSSIGVLSTSNRGCQRERPRAARMNRRDGHRCHRVQLQ